ncbi:MAG: hypothetical protein KF681_17965 [Bdellovibrionaceae bacterium]|nr:hypothetical protein [Pseudobdellovibrionaceae bacterium]
MIRFLLTLFLAAPVLAWAQLPVISDVQLKPGSSYTWTYYENGGEGPAYSAERYTILSNVNGVLMIQHSSRMDFKGDAVFKDTNRFRVDLKKCLAAHQDPRVKMAFMIEIFQLQPDGSFAPPLALQATAFEEKFNCHGIVRTGRPSLYTTYFTFEETNIGMAKLFQQKRVPDDQLGSFYFLDDSMLKGVAYKKDFNPGTNHHYLMRLTDWSQTP